MQYQLISSSFAYALYIKAIKLLKAILKQGQTKPLRNAATQPKNKYK